MTDSLLSRLQSLTAPSREIDGEIAEANGWHRIAPGLWRKGEYGWDVEVAEEAPRYTEIFDTAVSVMPPDPLGQHWRICVERFSDGWYAMIELRIDTGPIGPEYRGNQAATPAIALLIALEKAKEESKS